MQRSLSLLQRAHFSCHAVIGSLLWAVHGSFVPALFGLALRFFGQSSNPVMTVLNLANASAHLWFKSCVTLRRLHRKGQLDDYLKVGPDKRAFI